MNLLEIEGLEARVDGTDILRGLDLTVGPGEVHAIMGPNGSGKSTLAQVIAGREEYEVTAGSVRYQGEDLLAMAPEERARSGVFLAFQYPIEIPGVNNTYLLKAAVNAQRKARGEPEIDAFEFMREIKDKMKLMQISEEFLHRSVNEGFSGGEKKRNEVLQMMMLEPTLCVLDETDSGLDVDALKIVAAGINSLRNESRSVVLVTHYERLLELVVPDFVHVLAGGRIVKSGDHSLARELRCTGLRLGIARGFVAVDQADLSMQLDELAGRQHAGTSQAARRAALERFNTLGLPDRRIETWRYTNIDALGGSRFRYVAPEPDSATLNRVRLLLPQLGEATSSSRLLFVDGHLIDCDSLLGNDNGMAVERWAPEESDESEATALTALSSAFAPNIHRLHLSRDIADPIELVFACTGQGLAPQLRLRIDVEAGVTATVIQRFVDLPGTGEAWLNFVADIDLARESNLTLYRMQTKQPSHFLTSLQRARLADGARFVAGHLELGGALVRNELQIALDGGQAETDVFSLSLTKDRQHVDTRIAVDHRAAQTTSHQNQRAILTDKSRAVFNGKVTVQPDAQHIEARQRSDSLLLSPDAEADTKPELEIYADQVVCSHGATIGQLDEDHLFYLRARGIDSAAARSILTTAFAGAILERFRSPTLREEADRAVGGWFASEGDSA